MPMKKPMRPTKRVHGNMLARKRKSVIQSRIIGARAIDLSDVEVNRTGFKTALDTSTIDDLESRNGGFEIGCSDFEDFSSFNEDEDITQDALEKIFHPDYGGSD